jgi:hypothetical protein
MRLEYAAGERMFVDFAGDTVPVTDPETGEIWNAQVFVSVLWNQKSTEFSTDELSTLAGDWLIRLIKTRPHCAEPGRLTE